MFLSLSDTHASGLSAKLPLLPKWSSHFQGERLHGITHFVLGITFSLPVWLSGMDMAGWLSGRQMEAAGYPDTCWEAVMSQWRGVGRIGGHSTLSMWCVDESVGELEGGGPAWPEICCTKNAPLTCTVNVILKGISPCFIHHYWGAKPERKKTKSEEDCQLSIIVEQTPICMHILFGCKAALTYGR